MSNTQIAVLFFVVGAIVAGSYLQFAEDNGVNLAATLNDSNLVAAGKDLSAKVSDVKIPLISKEENKKEETAEMVILATVTDQSAGNSVFVSGLTLSKSTWVAIHEDAEGEPGKILGAGRFDAGTASGNVELLRATIGGGVYYVLFYEDNGDRAFDKNVDQVVKDASGKIVMVSFKAL